MSTKETTFAAHFFLLFLANKQKKNKEMILNNNLPFNMIDCSSMFTLFRTASTLTPMSRSYRLQMRLN